MRELFLTFAVGFFLSNACVAAPITVRSGEHGTFSRLVFLLPKDPGGWEIEETETGYSVLLEDNTARFRTNEVFQRIDRHRLIELRSSEIEGRLDLVLGCPCTAKTFSLSDGLLVIDIHDPPPSEQVPETKPLETNTIPNDARTEMPVKLSLDLPETRLPENTSEGRVLEAGPAGQGTNRPAPSHIPQLTDSSPLEVLESHSRTALAQERLLKQLARAASQGFLEPVKVFSPDQTKAPKKPTLVENRNDQTDDTGPKPQQIGPPDTEKVFNAYVSSEARLSSENLTLPGQVALRELATECLSDSHFAFENWVRDMPLPVQIGHWRGDLLNEAGRFNTEAATNLTRLYLYYGFGAEALSILEMISDDTKDVRIARALARLVDGLPPKSSSELDGLMHCDTRAALWALLSAKTVLPSDNVNIDSVLAAFSALPIHLRRYLGPNVSGKLLDLGNEAAAQSVLAFVRRGQQKQGPRLDMAQAQLEMSEGDTILARETFEKVARMDSEMSPQALIALVRLHEEDSLFLEKDTASLASAFALEHRNGTLGPELRRTAVVARALAGQFDTAIKALDEIEKRDGAQLAFDTRSDLFLLLSRKGNDIAFLTLALPQLDDLSEAIGAKASNATGERLLALGFPREARSLLKGSVTGKTGRERRLLRSRAALADFKPRDAEAELLGLTGADVDLLRAQARAQSGDYGLAQSLFGSLNKPEETLHSAWMSSDWKTLSRSADPTYAAIGRMASDTESSLDNDQAAQTEDTLILARNRALLQESATARDVLSDLLNKHDITAEVDQ